MSDMIMLEAVERYIYGKMTEEERARFEKDRQEDKAIDQLVIEHTLFLDQLHRFSERKKMEGWIRSLHDNFAKSSKLHAPALPVTNRWRQYYHRYKAVAAMAACVALFTVLAITPLLVRTVSSPSPKAQFEKLNKKYSELEYKSLLHATEIDQIKKSAAIPQGVSFTAGGTGFLIDKKGYLITNAHVVQGASTVAIQNNTGEFLVKVVYLDPAHDLAVLQIVDDGFKELNKLPYSFSKKAGQLADPVFALGFPRTDIVYSQGYLSALTGYNGDTLSCQVEILANSGNSGSPIINTAGEVIGILNGRQSDMQNFTFAIHGKYIYQICDSLKKNDSTHLIQLDNANTIASLPRSEQVKKVKDCVFMVKTY